MTKAYVEIAEDSRLTTYPIGRPLFWKFYKEAEKSFWGVEEIELSRDKLEFRNLSDGEQLLIKYMLAFFASADVIVNSNLSERIMDEVDFPEAKNFYAFQMAIEVVHSEMYSLLLDTLIDDEDEKTHLLNSIKTIPIISEMSDWMFDTIQSQDTLAVRLLRMACVEGVFFTGCFCIIYWFQSNAKMPGLASSNELISRDEALHTLFALEVYKILKDKPSVKEIYKIFNDAVDIAKRFANDALPKGLKGMNAQLLGQYIECVADNLLTVIDVKPLFNSPNPFPFMNMINCQNKTDFFARNPTEYSKKRVADTTEFEMADDF